MLVRGVLGREVRILRSSVDWDGNLARESFKSCIAMVNWSLLGRARASRHTGHC
jgi:hypothetical protein